MTLVLTVLGALTINGLAILAVSITSLAIILVTRTYKFVPRNVGIRDVAMLGVFGLTLTYMAIILGYWGWANPGDVMLHSNFVSLLILNGKFGLSLTPIAPEFPFNFPPGFHILAANYALLTGALPAETVFLLGGAITILIQVLFFMVAYVATKSISLSALGYFSTFAIHPSLNLERWVLGYFYNGPYPFLFAISGIVCFFAVLILRETEGGWKSWPQPAFLPFMITVWMVVTYSPYAAFLFVFFLVDLLVTGRKNLRESAKKLATRPGLSYAATVGGLVLYSQITLGLNNILRWATTLWNWVVPFPLQSYSITPAIFFDSFLGVSGLIAALASIYLVVFARDFRAASIFYLIIYAPTVFFLLPGVGGVFYFLLPLRTTVVTQALSWLIIAIFSGHIIDRVPWNSALRHLRLGRGLSNESS